MSASSPVSVAILAFPETTASVTYGMYDLFMAAGRDWGMVVDGQPGPALVRPHIVLRVIVAVALLLTLCAADFPDFARPQPPSQTIELADGWWHLLPAALIFVGVAVWSVWYFNREAPRIAEEL